MIFGSKPSLKYIDDIPIYINGDKIECVEEFKYLCVYLDKDLTFEKHSRYIYNKASSKLRAIHKIRECIDQSMAVRLYKSLVLPHFEYCDTVYMTATKDVLHKLQSLQNRAWRTLLLTDHDQHVDYMHNELGLLYLSERRCLHFCFQLQKYVHTSSGKSLSK